MTPVTYDRSGASVQEPEPPLRARPWSGRGRSTGTGMYPTTCRVSVEPTARPLGTPPDVAPGPHGGRRVRP